jgi:hypothetical protein
MKKNWFIGAESHEEIRKRYHSLALRYHPDASPLASLQEKQDLTAKMAEINLEYEWMCKNFLSTKQTNQKTKEDFWYTEAQQSTWWQRDKEFAEAIDRIIRIKNVHIEICGTFIYLTGDTKPHAEYLGGKWVYDPQKQKKVKISGAGFEYKPNKSPDCWWWHPADWRPTSKKEWSMSQIRSTFGSEEVENKYKDDKNLN